MKDIILRLSAKDALGEPKKIKIDETISPVAFHSQPQKFWTINLSSCEISVPAGFVHLVFFLLKSQAVWDDASKHLFSWDTQKLLYRFYYGI